MVRASGLEPTLDLRALIEMVGLKQVIDQIDFNRLVDEIGVSAFVAQLSTEQREEIKRLLEE